MNEIALSICILSLVAIIGLWMGNWRIYGVGLGIGGVLFGGIAVGHFAKQYGLYTDNKVKALLNERNPNSANMVRQMCVTFSLSQEMNQSLDIAFKLNAMKGVFGLNAAFNEATEQKKTINGKLDIQFGCD